MSTVTGLRCLKGVMSYHAPTYRQQAVMHRGLRHINLSVSGLPLSRFISITAPCCWLLPKY